MTALKKSLLAAAVLAGSALSASAEIACNGTVCWHITQRHEFPPHAGVVIHPDTWRWGPSERFTWREHEGRGFWRGDRWEEF
jgi:hypothetical protein